MRRKKRTWSSDAYTRKAKREGYAARSVYKLEEIDERWKVLRSGDTVFDIGCAPGSWSAYAAKKIGSAGKLLGIDLQPVKQTLSDTCEIQQGDIFEMDVGALPRFDVVMSDMAPATTGHRVTDATRSFTLAERALELAAQTLKPGGHFIVKLLEGGDVPELAGRIKDSFEKLERLRPKATRKDSTEIFLIGLGFRPEH